MFRALAIGLILCPLTGCLLLNNSGCSKPPRDPIEARKWWEETVDHVPVGTLQCWYQASEFHRQRGSSATYIESTPLGMTMAGMYWLDSYYPTPIPAEWLPRVQARLAGKKSEYNPTTDWAVVAQYKNCTKQDAYDAWNRQQ
jgi:hypothetical protein